LLNRGKPEEFLLNGVITVTNENLGGKNRIYSFLKQMICSISFSSIELTHGWEWEKQRQAICLTYGFTLHPQLETAKFGENVESGTG
jgi:hypothetical protein